MPADVSVLARSKCERAQVKLSGCSQSESHRVVGQGSAANVNQVSMASGTDRFDQVASTWDADATRVAPA